MKYCYICGAENPDAAEKCEKCGKAKFALSYGEYLEFKFSGKPLSEPVNEPARVEKTPGEELREEPGREAVREPERAEVFKEAEPPARGLAREYAPFTANPDGAKDLKKREAKKEEFIISGGVVSDYKGTAEEVYVPDGVTQIGHSAFARNTAVKKVCLPEGLKVIGKRAFFHCDNLTKINLPRSLKRIEDSAFDGCGRLEEIVFPDGLEYIGEMAFVFCAHLKSVQIPASVQRIGSRAFGHCNALKSAALPKPLPELGWAVFDESVKLDGNAVRAKKGAAESGFIVEGGKLVKYVGKEKEVVVPFTVKFIGARAFSDSAAETVILPEKLYAIGAAAFAGCRTLKKIKIPSNVMTVGLGAFEGCSALKEVEIESGVTEIGESAFAYCVELKDVFIPAGVKTVGKKAFYCSGLQQLVCGAQSKPKGWHRRWNLARGGAFSGEKFIPQWGGRQFIHEDCVVHKK